ESKRYAPAVGALRAARRRVVRELLADRDVARTRRPVGVGQPGVEGRAGDRRPLEDVEARDTRIRRGQPERVLERAPGARQSFAVAVGEGRSELHDATRLGQPYLAAHGAHDGARAAAAKAV